MAKKKTPRFILRLNQIAAAHGLDTSVQFGQFPDEWRLRGAEIPKQKVILSVWRGTQDQFRATGLILPSFHFPLDRGLVSTPSLGPWIWMRNHPLIAGEIEVSKGYYVARLFGGLAPSVIVEHDGVEMCETHLETIFHGNRDALIATHACQAIHFPGKRDSKSNEVHAKTHRWLTRRLPDGSFVHWKENDVTYKARMADDIRISRESNAPQAKTRESYPAIDVPITHLAAARQLLERRFSLLSGPKWDWSRST